MFGSIGKNFGLSGSPIVFWSVIGLACTWSDSASCQDTGAKVSDVPVIDLDQETDRQVVVD
ncbi:MAG: hypothetical protein MI861_08930, partial [Pirellulales bacterium]|nr:hypothetical protein [Pirellulales bacterium]